MMYYILLYQANVLGFSYALKFGSITLLGSLHDIASHIIRFIALHFHN